MGLQFKVYSLVYSLVYSKACRRVLVEAKLQGWLQHPLGSFVCKRSRVLSGVGPVKEASAFWPICLRLAASADR